MNDIRDEYFDWLFNIVCGDTFTKKSIFNHYPSYNKVLRYLHSVEFRYTIKKDANRADDGVKLRYRFAKYKNLEDTPEELDGPCSVFEMMVALALRCEETIMDDPSYGNRTKQWFWVMMRSLGLNSIIDDIYDEKEVEFIVNRFLDRRYEPDGEGGLFRIKNIKIDLRKYEIWHQLCRYLDTII